MPASHLGRLFLATAVAFSFATLPISVTPNGLGGQDAFAKNNGNAGNGGAGKGAGGEANASNRLPE